MICIYIYNSYIDIYGTPAQTLGRLGLSPCWQIPRRFRRCLDLGDFFFVGGAGHVRHTDSAVHPWVVGLGWRWWSEVPLGH